uniref:Scaffold protein involved in DNA repair n=1 Tax=Buteo japonicus TaxID=224669 RepID=A0A8C0BTQ0_9AVES
MQHFRKRFWNAECTPFPDETPLQLKKSNVRTSVAATSISDAWLRCGDGFQSTSVKTLYKYFILDESELIDWEKGSDSTDRCDESEKDDSSLEISDSDSCTNLNSLPVKEENNELCKVRNCFKFKEKKKLLLGGLAERLYRLQNRERSAISFWRHQCISDAKTASDKSGVLIVKILEMFEECTIQVAICQQLEQSPAMLSSEDVVINAGEPILKVLFARETAAHLKSRPQDVIHIYPPWQKLLLRNADVPVIMHTYFSQKVLLSEHSETREKTYGLTKMLIRKNITSLAQTFSLDDLDDELRQESSDNQVRSIWFTHPLARSAVNDSLLEMVESQGAVGWREAQVRVVIQRVYCLPAREGYRSHTVQATDPPMSNGEMFCRLCLLVQDAYGMFSEVQFQSLTFADDIEQYCRRWEGKFCCLAGMKILQRTTRGRALGLFSLIDSLWPPVVPVKVAGQSQTSEMMTTNLPPPSFCYILTAQSGEIHVEVDEEEQISNLYQPPAVHGLKEILQINGCNERCSFWAQVLYLRLQTKHSVPINQREISLFVTDSTLQNVVHMIPKVVAVSVAASCVLSTEITEALSVASQLVFFKDVLWGNGRIICVERTVLLLQKPLLYSAAGADLSELTGPVRLDELDSTTQANSICAVKGTVVGVNESTAFSWPTCDRCGNGKLELCPQDRGLLYCNQCSEVVISPVLKMQLEVFLSCPSRSQSTVKVKVWHEISFGSYEVQSVLGKEVGLLNCYVHSVTSHPNCVALEEIVLLEAAARH